MKTRFYLVLLYISRFIYYVAVILLFVPLLFAWIFEEKVERWLNQLSDLIDDEIEEKEANLDNNDYKRD